MDAAWFAIAAVGFGGACLYASQGWPRAIGFCWLLVAIGALWWASLGQPRPVLGGTPQGVVAAFRLDEPRAIYVWLVVPGGRVPLALALPWSEADAAALNDAAEQAKRRGTQVRMGRPGGGGTPTHGRAPGASPFYAAPASALPPKATP